MIRQPSDRLRHRPPAGVNSGARLLLCLALSLTGVSAAAGEPADPKPGPQPSLAELQTEMAPVLEKALAYLQRTQQPDGGWIGFGQSDPAITALVAKCFTQSPLHGPKHPVVKRALEYVLTFTKEDGGIYVEGQRYANYHTSVCLMSLAATGNPIYKHRIERAQQFLSKLQWDEGEGYEPDSPWYGGAGYGRHKRPDLSNTQMMIEALHQSGLPPEHPVYRKAIVFITRSQMLSRTNDQAFAGVGGDGGFIYTPANGGESKAGQQNVEGRPLLRSYGSMTYAGFKSLLHADVDRNDVRVRRALDWIRNYYTLDSNPNMPGAKSREGLFYYYHTFAKALAAWGEDEIVDADGIAHRWREELCAVLGKRQQPDGSFVNTADRWMEGNPALVTAYSVLAIQTALEEPNPGPG